MAQLAVRLGPVCGVPPNRKIGRRGALSVRISHPSPGSSRGEQKLGSRHPSPPGSGGGECPCDRARGGQSVAREWIRQRSFERRLSKTLEQTFLGSEFQAIPNPDRSAGRVTPGRQSSIFFAWRNAKRPHHASPASAARCAAVARPEPRAGSDAPMPRCRWVGIRSIEQKGRKITRTSNRLNRGR